jgi:hypothetical protein
VERSPGRGGVVVWCGVEPGPWCGVVWCGVELQKKITVENACFQGLAKTVQKK